MTTESGCCDGRTGNGGDSVCAECVFGENEQLEYGYNYRKTR